MDQEICLLLDRHVLLGAALSFAVRFGLPAELEGTPLPLGHHIATLRPCSHFEPGRARTLSTAGLWPGRLTLAPHELLAGRSGGDGFFAFAK